MSRFDYVTSVLHELGSEMGMGPLNFDDSDRLSLYFDDLLVTLSYNSEPIELLWLYVDLGELPSNSAASLRHLHEFGFQCWAQNVMTIGFDTHSNRVVGYTSVPVSVLKLEALREILSGLIDSAMTIKESLACLEFENSQEETEDTPKLETAAWNQV